MCLKMVRMALESSQPHGLLFSQALLLVTRVSPGEGAHAVWEAAKLGGVLFADAQVNGECWPQAWIVIATISVDVLQFQLVLFHEC